MKSVNKIIVAILIVLILILMAGGVFAYLYLATDLFRTDEEMFYKYFSQILSKDGFIDNRIKQYNEKKDQMPYENSGKITVNVEYPEGALDELVENADETIENANKLEIKFSGKNNKSAEKVEQNIEIDYGNNVTFPIIYRQDGKNIGLKLDKISKQFIGVKNEKIDEFASKFGMQDIIEIPEKIDLENNYDEIDFTDEEMEQLKQIYGEVLEQSISEENFTSIKTKINESYTLELNNTQVKNIMIKMLESTKQNTLIIDKLNKIILSQNSNAEKIDASVIDDIINEINGNNNLNRVEIPNLRITLVQSNEKLIQVIIGIGDTTISIDKGIAENSLNYNIKYEVMGNVDESTSNSILEDEITEIGNILVYFNVQYSGLDNLKNVQENYDFGFEYERNNEVMAYGYKINSNIEFVESVSIDPLDKNVALFLNDYTGEQIITFMTNLGTKISEINKKQMNELGLKEYENPLLYSNPLTTVVLMKYIMFNITDDAISSVDLTESEKTVFNAQFEQYQGTNLSGSEINALIQTVQISNSANQGGNGHLVKITLNGNEIFENVDITKLYNVSVAYDLDGFIIEIKITK